MQCTLNNAMCQLHLNKSRGKIRLSMIEKQKKEKYGWKDES